MKFVYYSSLRPEAKRAMCKGDGKHGKFAVSDNHIAVIDDSGRALDWIKVIKTKGASITNRA